MRLFLDSELLCFSLLGCQTNSNPTYAAIDDILTVVNSFVQDLESALNLSCIEVIFYRVAAKNLDHIHHFLNLQLKIYTKTNFVPLQ